MGKFNQLWLIFLGVLVTFLSSEANAKTPVFSLPIDCVAEETCWIVNYVDVDKAKSKVADYKCGWRSYDKHKGVDFGIRDLKVMEKGVLVLAAAPGKVAGFRDGMDDISVKDLTSPKVIKGRECGNGVVLKHQNGWVTQYCHMKKGSVSVKKGDVVKRGQVLGKVGLSGKTEFPHVHFQAQKEKVVIDPFLGEVVDGKCGEAAQPLWEEAVIAGFNYGPSIYLTGFSASKPKAKAIRKGLYQDKVLGRNSPVLIMWADIFGLAKDDKVEFKIFGPEEDLIFSYPSTVNKNSARRMIYAGKPKKKRFWDAGTYIGHVTLVRGQGTPQEKTYNQVHKIEIR